MHELQPIIEEAFEQRASITPDHTDDKVKHAVQTVLNELNTGRLRVAEPINGEWVTHQWLKKAVLLSFRLNKNKTIEAGFCQFYDKVALKYEHHTQEQFQT